MTSSVCPLCNGLLPLHAPCPNCGQPLTDGGRLDDYTGPYAPYRPIDDMKLTNGYPDLAEHTCIHRTYCAACGRDAVLQVKEWDS
ncbi:hypothetical protein [Paenibacillus flagellatus]|uniref:Uncharacterized protein n=1 Tax=Paenibacillus flagellatus TaxID=2211139 RepID=A0A2V5K3S5_9BACL|nr:hypothetical protein [Paenibacillus flagellatus]PYI53888.1 hypothetical protein DLM86_15145 [Paenibacillus flagellatus]